MSEWANEITKTFKPMIDSITALTGTLTQMPCMMCEDKGEISWRQCVCGITEEDHHEYENGDHTWEWDGEEDYKEPCPDCAPQTFTMKGLTYVAIGVCGGGVILESDCKALLHDLGESGPSFDDVGLEGLEDEGIWKGVVKLWTSRSYEGEHDQGYDVIGEWVEVKQYPEPECVKSGTGYGPCEGMRSERTKDGIWACDGHAGQVA